jgi:hypothetical protein
MKQKYTTYFYFLHIYVLLKMKNNEKIQMSDYLNEIETIGETPTKNDNFIIFMINGGIGKNIVATAVAKAIKKQYPNFNIVVVSAWTEVWQNNPYIYRFYRSGNIPYFYSNYVENKHVKLMIQEPYLTQDYAIEKNKNLAHIWCNTLGINYNNETPALYFNAREVEFAENHYIKNRNIFVLQTNGGAPNDNQKISWMRDIPLDIAQYVVNMLSGDFHIYHIRRNDQPALNNTEMLNTNIRYIFYVISKSKGRLFMDSFAQHAAAAFDMKSTVLWVKNSPIVTGHSLHDNLLCNSSIEMPTTGNSFIEPYDISGIVEQCPFPQGTILFDKKEVLQSVVSNLSKK